ncbi:MAG: metal-dependent transcriptional regulator [Spirochaetales bacterium]|nr:metal-dependent transcriptional regulator [Spirochaetales bacterium]
MVLTELKRQFPAAPEYLTQIFLIQRDTGEVTNAGLADRLNVSRPAVSQAIGRLRRLGLVEQDKYGTIALSLEGENIGKKIVRRHFLLEHLLVGLLKYPWDKADKEAESLQDALSDDFTEFLSQRLGNPQTCPHGNPMPDSALEERYLQAPPLSGAPLHQEIRLIRITEEGELLDGLLPFCLEHQLLPGRIMIPSSLDEQQVVVQKDEKTLSIPIKFAQLLRWEAVSSK